MTFFFFLILSKILKAGTGEGLTDSLAWGLSQVTVSLLVEGQVICSEWAWGSCYGWLCQEALRAPLRNARVSSWQSFCLQPELTQGRSSECLMASLRSYAVTLPQVLTGQRPATTHGGLERWEMKSQADLEAGTVVAHMLRTGPVLIWKSSHYVGLLLLCSLTSVGGYSWQPCRL